VEEADAAALDMVVKKRRKETGTERHKHSNGLEGLRAFAEKEWK